MGRGRLCLPNAMIRALLSEARPDCRAFLLNDGPLVGNGLGRADVADELFHYEKPKEVSEVAVTGARDCVCPILQCGLRELIVRCQGPLGGRRKYLDQIDGVVDDAVQFWPNPLRRAASKGELYLLRLPL